MSEYPILLTSTPSPFGRVARAARLHLGLEHKIAVDLPAPADTKKAAQAISPLEQFS